MLFPLGNFKSSTPFCIVTFLF